MIELTDQQAEAVEKSAETPVAVINPKNQETFILLRADEYRRLKAAEYDDSPWTKEELHALAWETGNEAGWEEMTEYDHLPDNP